METVSAELNPGYANRWRSLFFICISLLVVSLDNTILNVAIPSISRDLGATGSELQWIIDSYILVFAALLLTLGALGDRFGRKRALQVGLVLFGIGSFAAGISHTTEMLIATRAFLGLAGALILPSTLSIVTATFPREERAQAIAIWAAVFGLGVGLGPLIGGWLIEQFGSWNAVFFVNLPVVVVAVIGDLLFVAESKDPSAPRIDVPGVVLSIIGLFALVYGIIEAGVVGWTEPNVLLAFAIAAVFLGAFGLWESRYPHAMLPMAFFRNMSFTGANLALVLVTFSLFGSVFFLSQYLQSVKGFTALEAGVRILPQALALTFMTSQSARISARLGTKYTVALGILISAAGLFYLSQVLEIDTPYSLIVIGQVLLTSGLGIAISPATNSVMGSVPVQKAGIGSAMNDTTRQLGGALGIAVLGTILNSVYLRGVAPLVTDVRAALENVPTPVVTPEIREQIFTGIERSIQGAVAVAGRISAANPALADRILQESRMAFVDGMHTAMLIGAIIMIGAALLTLAILPAQVQRPALNPIEATPSPTSGD
ncbi:MAG: MFS transporter [bacterium]|nr:MFS transporter [bacterium]